MDDYDNAIQLLESVPYRNLMNALQIVMVYRIVPNIIFLRPTVYLIPTRINRKKQIFLEMASREFRLVRGNYSMVFYQTPFTIQHNFSNQSIEVFVINSNQINATQSVFELNDRNDIHSQLNQMSNVHERIFEPERNTMLLFYDDYYALKNVKHSNINNVMMGDVNIFMANCITRNMRSLTTRQYLLRNEDKKYFRYNPSKGSIYGELFISSLRDYYYVPDNQNR